jgi:hypothetical protein
MDVLKDHGRKDLWRCSWTLLDNVWIEYGFQIVATLPATRSISWRLLMSDNSALHDNCSGQPTRLKKEAFYHMDNLWQSTSVSKFQNTSSRDRLENFRFASWWTQLIVFWTWSACDRKPAGVKFKMRRFPTRDGAQRS